eukprot:1157835-Pelagomonas_calceolata.AAC.4
MHVTAPEQEGGAFIRMVWGVSTAYVLLVLYLSYMHASETSMSWLTLHETKRRGPKPFMLHLFHGFSACPDLSAPSVCEPQLSGRAKRRGGLFPQASACRICDLWHWQLGTSLVKDRVPCAAMQALSKEGLLMRLALLLMTSDRLAYATRLARINVSKRDS